MAYIDTENIPLHMPVPGTREPAQIALLNENAVTLSNHDHTTGKALAVGRLRSGVQANRPAASTPGNVYFATDTGRFFVDTGTAWVEFITSGGQATVTGWTLVDPIIRDTLQFGPEGGAGVDASLTRVAANTFQFSGNVGVGVTPGVWDAAYPALQVGAGAALRGHNALAQLGLSSNTRISGGANTAILNAPGAMLVMDQLGATTLYTAPAPAGGAGTAQTFTARLAVYESGTLTLASALGAQAVDIQQQGTNINAAPSIQIRRAAPASQHQTIRFQNGASLGDYDIGRRAGSDDFRFMFWNGVALNDRMTLSPDGLLTVLAAAGTSGPAIQAAGTVNVTGGAGANNIIQMNKPSVVLLLMGEHAGSPNSPMLTAPSGNIFFNASGTIVCPISDASTNLGYAPGNRWYAVYASVGSIQTSHVSQKENFHPLDPAACTQAVLDTQWWSFDYKAPNPLPVPPAPEGETDEQREQREAAEAASRAAYLKMVEETTPSRKQKGFVLGSADHRTSDLFGQADRTSASPSSDLAVVACALQSALQRIAALEAASGQPATSA